MGTHLAIAEIARDPGVYVPLTLVVSLLGATGSMVATCMLYLWKRAQAAEASARRQRDDETQGQLQQVIKGVEEVRRLISDVEDRHDVRINTLAERVVRVEVMVDILRGVAKGAANQ